MLSRFNKKVIATALAVFLGLSVAPVVSYAEDNPSALTTEASQASVLQAQIENAYIYSEVLQPLTNDNGSEVEGESEQAPEESGENPEESETSEIPEAPADGNYNINSKLAEGKVVDARSGQTTDGTPIQSYAANGTDAQVWRTETDAEGYTTIYHATSGKVLDVANGQAYEGAKVQLWAPNNTTAQKWVIIADKDYFKIASALNRNFVLDISAGSLANGATIQLWSDNGTDAQRWYFTGATTSRERLDNLAEQNKDVLADGTFNINSVLATGKDIDLRNGSTSNGTVAQIFSNNGTDAQVWTVSHDAAGYITLTHTASGKVLDVQSANANSGAALQLYDSNGTWAQKWIAVSNGQAFKLVSALNQLLVIDVMWGNAVDGTALQLFDDNGTNAQLWTVSAATTTRMRLDVLAAQNKDVLADGNYGIRSDLLVSLLMDARGGGISNGTVIQTYSANDTLAQKWKVTHDSVGYVTLTNLKSSKVLDVQSANASNNAALQLYDSNGTYAQKWIAIAKGNSFVLMSALAENLAIDVPSGLTTLSNALQLYKANGTSAQSWAFIDADRSAVSIAAKVESATVKPINAGFGDKYLTLPSAVNGDNSSITFDRDVYSSDGNLIATADASITLGEIYGGTTLPTSFDFKVYDAEGAEMSHIFVMHSENISAIFVTSEDPDSKGRAWVESDPSHNNAAKGRLFAMAADGSSIYDGKLSQIKGRGNSSWGSTTKKPYQLKLDKKCDLLQTGSKDNKNKTWLLITDDLDKSHSRNNIAYSLAQLMGVSSAIDFDFVDFYYDGEYRGTYLLCEKVQINSGRVNITDLEDKNGDAVGGTVIGANVYGAQMRYGTTSTVPSNITGGYLIEHEYAEERYSQESSWFSVWTGVEWQHFVCKSPEVLNYEESNYISCLVQDLFDAFNNNGVVPTWRGSANAGKRTIDLLDVDSLARLYWLCEITKNADGFRYSSTYFYKDKGSSKIKFGPAWDFDLSAGNKISNIYEIRDTTGYFTRACGLSLGFMKDPYVVSALNNYKSAAVATVRNYLNNGKLDAQNERTSASLAMNATVWGDTIETFEGVRTWLNERMNWLEKN